jgi:hypothetical protein
MRRASVDLSCARWLFSSALPPARTSIATLVGELGDGLQKTQQCDSRSLRA